MKTIKIGFGSSWTPLDKGGGENSSILGFLTRYDVKIVPPEQADYLFYSVFNGRHFAEAGNEVIKIFHTGENCCPDFNACDYAISFEHMDYGDRHLRYPLYLFYPEVEKLESRPAITVDMLRARQCFCNFICSNPRADPQRDEWFRELDRRLAVHSAGRHMRNTDGLAANFPGLGSYESKLRYLRDFRFTLALENASHPGYVTEKIADAFIARTVPLYWGDPRVGEEFNEKAFVNLAGFASRHAALDFIEALNRDETRMLAMLNEPPLRRADHIQTSRARLRQFLEHIFDQDPEAARRRPRHGFAGNLYNKRRGDEHGYRKYLKRNRF